MKGGLPDFFLAGAPKCGTSSLFHWLNQHPGLVGSSVKEPFYFMDEDHPLKNSVLNFQRHGLTGWAQLFAPQDRGSGALLFEATTHLIYQRLALEVLPSIATQPRFVFLLRDPVRRLRSSFEYTRENLGRIGKGLSFERFVHLLLNQRGGELKHHIAGSASAYVLQRDLEYGDYARYLKGWLSQVGPERIHVVQLECLQRDPRACVLQLCEFLSIDPEPYSLGFDFGRKNETKAVRFHPLQRWARGFAQKLPAGELKRGLKRGYERLQKSPVPDTHLSSESMERLQEFYAPGKQWLVDHFSVELKLWGQSSAPEDRVDSQGSTAKE